LAEDLRNIRLCRGENRLRKRKAHAQRERGARVLTRRRSIEAGA